MKKKLNALRLVIVLLVVVATIYTGCKQATPPDTFPYDPKNADSSIISIKLAREYTANYRKDTSFSEERANPPIALAFNRDILLMMLNDTAYKGIRMYYARNMKKQLTMVLVPYDSQGNDIIHWIRKGKNEPVAYSQNLGDGGGEAGDNAARCPTYCDNGQSGLGPDKP